MHSISRHATLFYVLVYFRLVYYLKFNKPCGFAHDVLIYQQANTTHECSLSHLEMSLEAPHA